ncbi:hypothetical protein PIB30_092095 [Stylosanthes scabra]|uniref:Uncharacterized protein n=1 Tax=Stylosanthes scabra TaxID=79078 RepID=A0ABU6UU08_9FABA|nr:hypothetical protein [Stylosanthes scabra]
MGKPWVKTVPLTLGFRLCEWVLNEVNLKDLFKFQGPRTITLDALSRTYGTGTASSNGAIAGELNMCARFWLFTLILKLKERLGVQGKYGGGLSFRTLCVLKLKI